MSSAIKLKNAEAQEFSITQEDGAGAIAITSTQLNTLVANGVVDADIGVTVQGYDIDTAKLDVAQNYTAPQRSADTIDNDGSFDLNVAQNFTCTPTATFALTFTNIPDGQSGTVLLVNTGGHVITAGATTKVDANFLSTVSTAGTYCLGYYSTGTEVYVYNSGALA